MRADTPFCRAIVDRGASLASRQVADVRTTTEALRILAYAPVDASVFTAHRAARALQTLADRLMASRQGGARLDVAALRAEALGADGEPPRPPLARFAGALDGAHAESSAVAHELARAIAVLDGSEAQGGAYLPDDRLAHDPRFARVAAPIAFPLDAELERGSPERPPEDGPLHAYARTVGFDVSASLEKMLGSIAEAARLYPAAFDGCLETDVRQSPDPSRTDAPAAAATP